VRKGHLDRSRLISSLESLSAQQARLVYACAPIVGYDPNDLAFYWATKVKAQSPCIPGQRHCDCDDGPPPPPGQCAGKPEPVRRRSRGHGAAPASPAFGLPLPGPPECDARRSPLVSATLMPPRPGIPGQRHCDCDDGPPPPPGQCAEKARARCGGAIFRSRRGRAEGASGLCARCT
jgi:hypothetical protein